MSLITEIAEILPLVKVNTNITVVPDTTVAEQEYLLPILGEDLYSSLQEGYDAETLSEDMEKLLLYCQRVVAPGAFLKALALTQVSITDNGIVAYESQNARKAFKWEYNNVVETLKTQLYAAQEALILFLRKNSEEFAEWAESPYNDPEGFVIIRDGRELGKVISLQQPHRVYMKLRPLLKEIGETTITGMMGEEQYLALNAAILADDMTDEQEYVVKKLRLACGSLVMARAAHTLNVSFGDAGFTVADRDTTDSPDEGRVAADFQRESIFSQKMEASAMGVLKVVKDHMNKLASADVFPEYFESGLYADPEAVVPKIDNSAYKGVFGM